MGDKLTAFAPNTTGILYEKNKPAEIIKQLYDIGHLFDEAEDIEAINKTFQAVAKSEIGYRGLEIDPSDVLQDIFDTSVILSERNELDKKYQHLSTGVKNLFNFIFIEKFRIESAIICAAKAAYLAQLLKQNAKEISHRYQEAREIKEWSIKNKKYQKFDLFKRINPEAFFYWYHAINLLNE